MQVTRRRREGSPRASQTGWGNGQRARRKQGMGKDFGAGTVVDREAAFAGLSVSK